VIIDSSAWIEYFQRPTGPTGDAVAYVVRRRAAMTTDVVRLELMAGARSSTFALAIREALDACTDLAQQRLDDVEAAAELFVACRQAGETIRSSNDCLIAAIAIRNDVAVLHNDKDFDAIARHSSLKALRV